MTNLSIIEQLCFSTIRIETKDSNGNSYSGTGFFYRYKEDENRCLDMIVTNKHVVKEMATGMLRFTTADENGNPLYQNHYPLQIDNFEQNWIFHPDDDVDLCVFPFGFIVNLAYSQGKRLFYRTFDESFLPNIDNLNALDAVENVLMIGYPNGLWDTINNMPLIRKGITATNVKLDYNGKKVFLIDAACFPGSSGSPIILCDIGSYHDKYGNINFGKSRLFLLGILYAGPQYKVTGDIKIVTVPIIQQKIMAVSSIPNNLGLVIKSELIKDFIPLIKQK